MTAAKYNMKFAAMRHWCNSVKFCCRVVDRSRVTSEINRCTMADSVNETE